MYVKCSTNLEELDRERDRDSIVEWNKETKKAISAKTAQMYKQRMKNLLQKRDQ